MRDWPGEKQAADQGVQVAVFTGISKRGTGRSLMQLGIKAGHIQGDIMDYSFIVRA
jgi:hypothetical protein